MPDGQPGWLKPKQKSSQPRALIPSRNFSCDTLVTDEIVSADWATEIRPAMRAPKIDQPELPHERLKALRLAQRGQFGKPNRIIDAELNVDHTRVVFYRA